MIVVVSLLVGLLVAVGIYLVLQRSLTRVIVGFAVLAHGVNLLLLVAGGEPGRAPFAGAGDRVSDPLPEALALTAIVISFGLTAFLATLAFRSWLLTRNDVVQDDPEDRRIAAQRDPGEGDET